jgi:hypothetical protein
MELRLFANQHEESKHKDNQYFQEFDSNFNGIFSYLARQLYNLLLKILMKHFTVLTYTYVLTYAQI